MVEQVRPVSGRFRKPRAKTRRNTVKATVNKLDECRNRHLRIPRYGTQQIHLVRQLGGNVSEAQMKPAIPQVPKRLFDHRTKIRRTEEPAQVLHRNGPGAAGVRAQLFN